MREQLIQYVNLLFAGATGSDEIREEILQNTLDRYDDLIAQYEKQIVLDNTIYPNIFSLKPIQLI